MTMSLAGIGPETVEITRRGWYEAAGGRVSIAEAVAGAVSGTRLYRPDDYAELALPAGAETPASVEVTEETTAEAARRLAPRDRVGPGASSTGTLSAFAPIARVAALNFASAKNPGGGFLGGAKAQEEDLARCSALYACQLTQHEYYEANRATQSMLYTDHLIYSPDVPFFRGVRHELLPAPFVVTILTSPAPNAGAAAKRGEGPRVPATLARRAEHVLRVAAHHGHRTLVLGAWGCGVFRNDPTVVADVFARLLTAPPLAFAFDRVVFAIYDRTPARGTLRAFRERLGR
jgi:uncharacterized protein (TIGR02452 family)